MGLHGQAMGNGDSCLGLHTVYEGRPRGVVYGVRSILSVAFALLDDRKRDRNTHQTDSTVIQSTPIGRQATTEYRSFPFSTCCAQMFRWLTDVVSLISPRTSTGHSTPSFWKERRTEQRLVVSQDRPRCKQPAAGLAIPGSFLTLFWWLAVGGQYLSFPFNPYA
jgi:hypothetical protein